MENFNAMEMWEKEKCEYLDNIYNKNINNKTMKRILVTSEKLIEKIDNYKTNSKVHVIYFDIMNKKILDNKEFMSMIADNDNLYELENNVFFVRDAPIIIYKALLENIRKNIDDENLINRLLPQRLIDFNTNTEYYTDDEINDEIIKNMKF